MNRTSTLKIVISLAVTVGLCAAGCSKSRDVSRAIGEIVRSENASELRLAAVTDFRWDAAYFFGPYTPRSTICEALKVLAKDCQRIVPEESQDDGLMSIAFVSGSSIVRYEMHSRVNGDFTPVPAKQPVSAADAVFRVVPGGTAANGKPWFKLVLK